MYMFLYTRLIKQVYCSV